MIQNKDRKLKTLFKGTLERLKLKDLPEPTFVLLNPSGGTITFNNNNAVIHSIQPYEFNNDSLSVDDDGKVFLSDRDIDRIAQRVIDLLKKERLM